MDENVIAAMARWPDVPAVFGWLSLTERGEWRLHPNGDALDHPSGAGQADRVGESITSTPILEFINRNYACDSKGRWYFQNGPQRVYVRLDAAPYILHTSIRPDGATELRTHNGLVAAAPTAWWLDEQSRLYARTAHGPGMVAGRDLEAVLTSLRLPNGDSLLDALEQNPQSGALRVEGFDGRAAEFNSCSADDITRVLKFVRRPEPD